MKYNSTLFNKFLTTINNNTTNNDNSNNTTKKDNNTKAAPPTTIPIINMAAVTNNIPISNSLVTTTRFTDEYDLKEELGK
jgi:hypothetical protein